MISQNGKTINNFNNVVKKYFIMSLTWRSFNIITFLDNYDKK